ncbi:MAG: nucleoside triphosphate pyrophosphohydrolase [Leptospiraceae bacterium]|nr:MAG: nucleoside triphosphate pyrophosphohydrolase [Leptospiraceae bacterium]
MEQNPKNELLEKLNSIEILPEKLYVLVNILRNHCDWDKQQTLESLKQSLLEETYEVIQGIEEENKEKKIAILKEELGDLLFLVHFYIKLCEEQEYFTKEEVYKAVIKKLVKRHPHVFGNIKVQNTNEILKNWEGFKKKSFGENTEFLPALLRAQKVQQKASIEGFDWKKQKDNSHIKEILEQIKSEILELEQELDTNNKKNQELEIGDILFSIVNLARHLEISAELALHKSIEKFIKRFNKVLEVYQNHYRDSENKHQVLEEIYQEIKLKEQ